MDLVSTRVAPSQHPAILAHYARVAPLIARNFPDIPLVFAYHPEGLDHDPAFSNIGHQHFPKAATRIRVMTSGGHHDYPACDVDTILEYVRGRHTVHGPADGVHSWTPRRENPDAVRFARVLLKPIVGATQRQLRDALVTVRDVLCAQSFDTIPLFVGTDAALFIPFADGPDYDRVRAWLKTIRAEAIAHKPHLIVPNKKPNEERTQPRIEVTVSSNAPGEHSHLPYSLTGSPQLPMATPFDWSELDTLRNGQYTAYNAEERLAHGDIFAQLAAKLTHQTFGDVARYN
jgi:bifunctional non-homologous end joining protein LigD